MKLERISGLILATSAQIISKGMDPIHALKQIIIGFQQIGIFPIVIIIDDALIDLRYQMSKYGVIFLVSDKERGTEKIQLVKQGISFINNFSDCVIYTSLNVPLFYVDTLQRLVAYKKAIVVPSFQNKGGHPVIIRKKVFDELLDYTGENGLQGFFQSHSDQREYVEVNDIGISVNMRQLTNFNKLIPIYTHALFHPQVNVQLAFEEVLFDQQGKTLFFLIEEIGSVRQAAEWMGISYSKAWKMIDRLELALNTTFVVRRQGGVSEKRAYLTNEAKKLLVNYSNLEEIVVETTQFHFDNLFK